MDHFQHFSGFFIFGALYIGLQLSEVVTQHDTLVYDADCIFKTCSTQDEVGKNLRVKAQCGYFMKFSITQILREINFEDS